MNGAMNPPVADAEALDGSRMEQSLLVENEKAMLLSIPSLSSVPSTILHSKISPQLQPEMIDTPFYLSIFTS